MIRVDRGEEPDELPRERSTQLACAKIYGRPEAPNDFTGYGEEYVRNALLESQRFRCAYCELPIDQSGFPIEHFRPKVCADDVNWSVVGAPPKDEEFFAWFDRCFVDAREPSSRWVRGKDRYWWLAWSWENLFYACSACNSRAHKGNKFPLKPGSVNLSEMEVPPGSEIALLLDPSIFDPLDHIRFAPDREDNWGPIPRTDEGRWTIAILGLNKRPGLRDRWKHCARQIRDDPDFKFARDAISAGGSSDVRERWASALARLLHEGNDFLGLRWCVFDYYVPKPKRDELGLELPRPGRHASRAPKPLWEARPELAGLSEPIQLRVRAAGQREKDTVVQDLIVDLCAEMPMDVEALAKVLRRQPVTVQAYLNALTAGENARLVHDTTTKKFARR